MWLPSTGGCEELGDTSVCPHGMEVVMDPFGDGVCSCVVGNVPYRRHGEEMRCYPQYLQVRRPDGTFKLTSATNSALNM